MEFIGPGIDAIKDIVEFLTQKSRTSNITKRLILREIRDNLKLLSHASRDGVNHLGLIKELSNTALIQAFEEGFKFKNLRKGKLPATLVTKLNQKRGEKYIGWDAEQLVMSIEGKVNELKKLPKIYRNMETAPLNLTLRLSNLFLQLRLLALFIKSGR